MRGCLITDLSRIMQPIVQNLEDQYACKLGAVSSGRTTFSSRQPQNRGMSTWHSKPTVVPISRFWGVTQQHAVKRLLRSKAVANPAGRTSVRPLHPATQTSMFQDVSMASVPRASQKANRATSAMNVPAEGRRTGCPEQTSRCSVLHIPTCFDICPPYSS